MSFRPKTMGLRRSGLLIRLGLRAQVTEEEVSRSAIHGPAAYPAILFAMKFTFSIIDVGCPGPVVPITASHGDLMLSADARVRPRYPPRS